LSEPLAIVALISGRGSNLLAIADAIAAGRLNGRIELVISNRPDAAGLELAAARGLTTAVVDHRSYSDREAFGEVLRQRIDRCNPDLVVLAGFMRILSAAFVSHYAGRLLNIHPSLLPDYRGLDTHRRVLAGGEKSHGCSVHYVVPELDAGPVILQAVVPVAPDDTAETLAQRVLVEERRLYPQALALLAAGRVALDPSGELLLDGKRASPEQIGRARDATQAVS